MPVVRATRANTLPAFNPTQASGAVSHASAPPLTRPFLFPPTSVLTTCPCPVPIYLPPQAALAASPQPSRYDPLQALLKAEPITGSYKYCLAEVVLHGGWQQSLQEGLKDLPAWDPMANVVGARAAAASPGPRRPPSKYDMVGMALEGMAALPEELASGKWAEKQVRGGGGVGQGKCSLKEGAQVGSRRNRKSALDGTGPRA